MARRRRRLRRGGAVALALLGLLGLAAAPPGMSSALPPPATGSGVGGGASPPDVPRTEAEARSLHDDTVRKCRLLGVKAVRDECLREADRNLQRNLDRLNNAGAGATR